jgi:hypothetical protein
MPNPFDFNLILTVLQTSNQTFLDVSELFVLHKLAIYTEFKKILQEVEEEGKILRNQIDVTSNSHKK